MAHHTQAIQGTIHDPKMEQLNAATVSLVVVVVTVLGKKVHVDHQEHLVNKDLKDYQVFQDQKEFKATRELKVKYHRICSLTKSRIHFVQNMKGKFT